MPTTSGRHVRARCSCGEARGVLWFRAFRCAMHITVVRDNELRRSDDSIYNFSAFTQNMVGCTKQMHFECVRCDDALCFSGTYLKSVLRTA